MAAGTDFKPQLTVVDGGSNRDNVSVRNDEISEISDDLNQMQMAKSPREHSVVRRSLSGGAVITNAANSVRKYFCSFKLLLIIIIVLYVILFANLCLVLC